MLASLQGREERAQPDYWVEASSSGLWKRGTEFGHLSGLSSSDANGRNGRASDGPSISPKVD